MRYIAASLFALSSVSLCIAEHLSLLQGILGCFHSELKHSIHKLRLAARAMAVPKKFFPGMTDTVIYVLVRLASRQSVMQSKTCL